MNVAPSPRTAASPRSRGTPFYIAAELVEDGRATTASDLWVGLEGEGGVLGRQGAAGGGAGGRGRGQGAAGGRDGAQSGQGKGQGEGAEYTLYAQADSGLRFIGLVPRWDWMNG